MSDSEHDDEFEAYLKRRVHINKGSTPPDRLEPPPELDRIVIGNARKAIQGATPLPVYSAPRWALPVALAATILISLAVAFDLGLRAKRAAAPAVAESLTTQNSTSSPADGATDAGNLVAENQAAVSPAESTWVAQGLAAAPGAGQTVAQSQLASPVVGTPVEEGLAASHGAASFAKAAGTSADKVAADAATTSPDFRTAFKLRPSIATAPWPPVPSRRAAIAPAAARPSGDLAGSSDAARTRLARTEVAATRSRTEEESSVAANRADETAPLAEVVVVRKAMAARGAVAAASPVAASPVAAPPVASVTDAVNPSLPVASAPAITAASAPTRATSAPAAAAPPPSPVADITYAPARSTTAASEDPTDAATWVARIERLRRDGQTAEVEREIKRFRVAYPDYPLQAEAASHDVGAQ